MLEGWELVLIFGSAALIAAAVAVVVSLNYLSKKNEAAIANNETAFTGVRGNVMGETLYARCSECNAFFPQVANFCPCCGKKRTYP